MNDSSNEVWLDEPWRRPRLVARQILRTHLHADPEVRVRVGERLIQRRSDEALALWTARALTSDDLGPPLAELSDESWLERIVLDLTDAGSIGAVSMGHSTRAVIHALTEISSTAPIVHAGTQAVVHGLQDLDVVIGTAPPWTAEVTLIPLAAAHEETGWTSAAGATALAKAQRSMVLVDPLTRLDSSSVGLYRPDAWLRPVTTSG